jgi:lactate permease
LALDPNILGSITFLLPIITLFVGFLILKWDALKVSIAGWIVEIIVILFAYPEAEIMRASIWADISLWNAFAVIWTGFIFGQMYRNTGLLERLVKVLDSLFKHKWGKALTLSGVVGGLIGAFNGYATYPVTIQGIKELGYKGWRAATGYLVFLSSSIPFVSLWIAGTVAETSSHVPIAELVPYIGLLTIPLVFVSTFGFAHILKIDLRAEHNFALLILALLGAITGRIIFTQIIPSLYLLTLIGSSVFILLYLVLYSRIKNLEREKLTNISIGGIIRPFAPIVIGILVIILWKLEPIASIIARAEFTINLWNFSPVKLNLLNNPGFYILLIALSSYLFKIHQPKSDASNSNPFKDLIRGSRRSYKTMLTLFFGSGLVGMMLNAGQIAAVRNIIINLTALAYSVVLSLFSFASAMVFAEGLPADFLLSSMQIGVDVKLPLAFLVAIIAIVTMGVADPVKPSLLKYTSTLAEAPDTDEPNMFRTALVWQLTEVAVIVVEVVLSVTFLFH